MQDKNRESSSYDVVILGGGPAGAATALALKKRDDALRVALIEKTDYSGVRIGETLPPPARTLLAELGIWDAFIALAPKKSYGTRAAWGSPDLYENEFIFSPCGHGWHLDRRAFDAMLTAEAARAGVEVILQATPLGPPRHKKRWILAIQDAGGDSHELSAKFVVDATGRRSWFAHSQGVRHLVYDRLAGAFIFFRFDPVQAPADTYTFIEACEQGWWYSAMLPGHRMVVAFMSDAATLRRLNWRTFEDWRSLAASAPHTSRRLAGGTPLGKPVLHSACSQRLETPVGDDWLAVGDAASTFDPLSSQGIVKALRGGISAAHVVCRHLLGQTHALGEYAAALAREYRNYLDARAAYYQMEQRWPDSPFWQRRQEIITLHPQQPLHFHSARGNRLATRLPESQLKVIAEICSRPCTASEIVEQLHIRAGRMHSDRHIVLALQQLAEEGVLVPGPVHAPDNLGQEILVRRNANAI